MLRKKRRTIGKAKVSIEHTGFYAYLVRYLEWQKVKGYSLATLTAKDSALRQFIAWCDERSLEDPRAITKPMLERYQRHLFYYRRANGQALSFSTQNTSMSAVKTWFKWLTRENYLPSNPASEVAPVKRPKRLPEKILSVDDIESMVTSIDTDTLQGIRLRAMIEVLYSTGIRRGELCGLQVHDVDPQRHSLFVRQGKGAKDRSIPIGHRALIWLDKYLEKVRPKLILDHNEHSLFLTDYGEPYSTGALGHTIRKVLQENGVERGGCHLFRHAMATHMLENGAELRYIQAILGHADISTTTVYTHLCIDQLRRIHESTHPAEQTSPANPLALH